MSVSVTVQQTLAEEYVDALDAVRTALGGGGTYPRTLPAATTTPRVVRVDLSNGGQRQHIPPVTLIYDGSSAYIYGYVGENGGTVRFGGTDAPNFVPVAQHTLGFKPDYLDMGWDKSNNTRTVTLSQVVAALYGLATGEGVSKGDMITILIAFAEAARFKDIERAVLGGTSFPGKCLDWSYAQRAMADLLLRKA